MIRRVTALRSGMLCLALLWSLTALAQDPPSPLRNIELQDGDCIVFLGDSITHQCLYTQYLEDYFYTRFPKQRLKLHNAGVGGARAWDALQRFEEDVATLKPKYVTVLLGMNDGTYQPFQQDVFDTYQKDMLEVIERIRAASATPILMTPTMFDARAKRMNPKNDWKEERLALYNSTLAYYGAWLRDTAVENGFGFVDMYGPLNTLTFQQRRLAPAFTMIADSVHPGPDGQVVMAAAIVDDLQLPRRVSTIAIRKTQRGWRDTVQGGKLTDLQEADGKITFTFLADSLPWVLPPAAKNGVDLTKLGHRFSREVFRVQGLPEGKYILKIDGVEVGEMTAARLSNGVELQANEKTPQYQQALQVALLNQQRNENGVRGLRNQWGQFQTLARKRQQLSEKPDDEKLQSEVRKLEEAFAGHADRVASQIAAAKEIEDQIYEANQPVARNYELRRAP